MSYDDWSYIIYVNIGVDFHTVVINNQSDWMHPNSVILAAFELHEIVNTPPLYLHSSLSNFLGSAASGNMAQLVCLILESIFTLPLLLGCLSLPCCCCSHRLDEAAASASYTVEQVPKTFKLYGGDFRRHSGLAHAAERQGKRWLRRRTVGGASGGLTSHSCTWCRSTRVSHPAAPARSDVSPEYEGRGASLGEDGDAASPVRFRPPIAATSI